MLPKIRVLDIVLASISGKQVNMRPYVQNNYKTFIYQLQTFPIFQLKLFTDLVIQQLCNTILTLLLEKKTVHTHSPGGKTLYQVYVCMIVWFNFPLAFSATKIKNIMPSSSYATFLRKTKLFNFLSNLQFTHQQFLTKINRSKPSVCSL